MYKSNGKERNVNMEYYNLVLRLMLEDYKKKGITIQQADELYDKFNIITIYKNRKVEFINE